MRNRYLPFSSTRSGVRLDDIPGLEQKLFQKRSAALTGRHFGEEQQENDSSSGIRQGIEWRRPTAFFPAHLLLFHRCSTRAREVERKLHSLFPSPCLGAALTTVAVVSSRVGDFLFTFSTRRNTRSDDDALDFARPYVGHCKATTSRLRPFRQQQQQQGAAA